MSDRKVDEVNPHELDELNSAVIEWGFLWNKETPHEEILSCIEKYKFGDFSTFTHINKKGNQKTEEYSRKAVLQKLKRHKNPHIFIQDGDSYETFSTLSSTERSSIIQLVSKRKYLKKSGVQVSQATNQAISFVSELSSILKNFNVASISGEFPSNLADFYNDNDIRWVPNCFDNFLTWMHFLHPSYYTKYLTREDILKMPAQEIQEWENGIIQVQMFDHPFNYDAPENRQIIVEASEYLNERHRVFRESQKE
ncbi:MAG: hypothetical protein AAGG51_01955 [Cyanobacteria bacterium P01_G01_bin.54]